jgi:hypothetical protein
MRHLALAATCAMLVLAPGADKETLTAMPEFKYHPTT